jgi:sugar lactone lactonase YvrE
MSWLNRLFGKCARPRGTTPRRRSTCRLAVEALEERLVPAFDLTISTAADAAIAFDAAGHLTATGHGANINVADIRNFLTRGINVTISNGNTGNEHGIIIWQAGAALDYAGIGPGNQQLTIAVDASSSDGSLNLNAPILNSVPASPANLNLRLSAMTDLAVNTQLSCGVGSISLSADTRPDGTGDNGVGTVVIAPGATVQGGSVALRGAAVSINPGAQVSAARQSTLLSSISAPADMIRDSAGNLYLANSVGGTITRVAPNGQVTLFASGFSSPDGLALDSSGNLYVSNLTTNTVSKVTPAGQVSTFATGFNGPAGLAFDAQGFLYVANHNGGTISRVTPDGASSTPFGGPFTAPQGLAFFQGNLYVADPPAGMVAVVSATGQTLGAFLEQDRGVYGLVFDPQGNLYCSNGSDIRTVSPTGQTLAVTAGFPGSTGLAIDPQLNLYIASRTLNNVFMFPLAGQNAGQGTLFAAAFANPSGLAFDGQGNVYIADAGGMLFKAAPFGEPSLFATVSANTQALAVDAQGNVYVASANGTVSKVTPDGQTVTTFLKLQDPTGLAVDPQGFLYVADAATNTVLKATLAGQTVMTYTGFSSPAGLALDAQGNLYVANKGTNTVSRVTFGGVATFATGFNAPRGLTVDNQGFVYVTNADGTVSQVTPDGQVVSTFAGGFSTPAALGFDGLGTIYVADSQAGTVTKVSLGTVTVHSSLSARPISLGDSPTLIDGIYLRNDQLSRIQADTGIVFGDAQQTGNISITAAALTAATGGLILVEQNMGPGGSIVLNDLGGTATALNAGTANVSLIGGKIVAANPSNSTAEIATTGLVALSTNGGTIGTASNRIQFDATSTPSRVLLGGSLFPPGSVFLDGLGDLTVAGIVATNEGGGAVDITARVNLTVAAAAALSAASISLAADLKPDGTGDDGMGSLSLGAGASVTANQVTLRGADVNIDTSANPASVNATRMGSVFAFQANVTPAALAVDPQGNVYLADSTGGTVSKATPDGQTITPLATGLTHPQALTRDSQGNLFVAGSNGTLSKITPGGQVVPLGPKFTNPVALAVDGQGNLFVADAAQGRVSKLTAGGVLLTPWGTGFIQSVALAVDAQGNLYVGDAANGTVSKVTPTGQTSAFATGLGTIRAMTVDAQGNLFVVNQAGVLFEVTPDGHPTTLVSTLGSAVVALVVDGQGNIFFAEGGFVRKLPPGTITVRASVASLSVAVGGTNNTVKGVNLSAAAVGRLFASDVLTFGDTAQTGDITLRGFTSGALLTQVVQSAAGPGALVLDETNGATSLATTSGTLSLSGGRGGIQETNFGPTSLGLDVGTGTLDLSSGGSVGSPARPVPIKAARLGPGTIAGDLFLTDFVSLTTAGTLTAATASFTFDGDFTIRPGDLQAGSITLFVFGVGNQVLDSGGQSFGNVTHHSVGTLRLAGHPLTVSGNLTNQAGGFDANDLAVSVGGLTTLQSGTYLAGAAPQTFSGGLIVDGTFQGGSGPVTVGGLTLAAGSSFLAPSTLLTDTGDWTNGGGTFDANGGTVVLAGVHQTLRGSSTFHDLTKTAQTADTLTFEPGSTQTVTGTLTLQGSAGGLLALRSTVPGTPWNINPQGPRAVSFVDVQDSTNTNATPITPSGARNSGGNTNWVFPTTTGTAGGTATAPNLPVVSMTGPANNVSTIGVFDPTTGRWYLRNSNSPGAPDITPFAFGAPGWFGVVGDWDGNGSTTIGVVDPTTETWYLRNSNTPGAPDITPFRFGAPGWIPLVGDWTGSGHVGIGVFDPLTATFYLRNEVSPGGADAGVIRYGAPGWVPVVGDWDGNGTTTIGVVDPTTETWYLRNSNTGGAPDITPFAYGGAGWKPVVGDWNGDGRTTVGVVNPANETWYLRNSNSPGGAEIAPFAYGAPGWTPLAGTWSGAGRPLHLAASGTPALPGVTTLMTQDLSGILAAALARVQADGMNPTRIAQLAATQFVLGQLGGGELALAQPGRVVFDATAAGHGWFVDPTPGQDEEFAGGSGSALKALANGPAAGRVDLLTAVMQELGQEAGLTGGSLTNPLGVGVRNVAALDALFAGGT